MLAEALSRLEGSGVEVLDVGLRRPDLDDVFLSLTGHVAEDDEKPEVRPICRRARARRRPRGAPEDLPDAVFVGQAITRRT